jgi:hypothetical protein
MAFTRRGLFAIVGSLSGAPSLAAASRLPPPVLEPLGAGYAVRFGNQQWIVDPNLFGPDAQVFAEQVGERISLSLHKAFFAGTDLRVDFHASIARAANGWRIRLAVPALGFGATCDLGAWLGGTDFLAGPTTKKNFKLGLETIEASLATWEITPPFDIRIASPRGIRLDGALPCTADGLYLKAVGPDPDSYRQLVKRAGRRRATRYALINPKFDEKPLALGRTHGGGRWSFDGSASGRLEGEVFDDVGGPAGVLVHDRSGVLARSGGPSKNQAHGLRLEAAAIAFPSDGRLQPRAAIGARVARAPQALDVGDLLVTVSGDDEAPFFAKLGGGRQQDIFAEVRLEKIALPVAGADSATVFASGAPIKVMFASPQSAEAHCPTIIGYDDHRKHYGPPFNMIWLCKGQPFLVTATQNMTFNVRRSIDMLNLTFSFPDYVLHASRQVPPYIGQARLTRKNPAAKSTIIVTFPPQHVAETILEAQEVNSCPAPGKIGLSAARLAKPSRVVFTAPATDVQWADFDLTIENLTNWANLGMLVHERALPEPGAPVEEQLKRSGVGKQDAPEAAMVAIARGLSAPSDRETCLELSSHLLFSPGPEGRWLTPGARRRKTAAKTDTTWIEPPPPNRWTPLWHARLEESESTLRAIWSDLLVPGAFNKPKAIQPSGQLQAMTAQDHWELILQTSVYGVPALLRAAADEKPGEGPPPAPIRGGVVRPETSYAYLNSRDYVLGVGAKLDPKDVGVALAEPFQEANVALTPWGASVKAQWRGIPPLIVRPKDFPGKSEDWPISPDLERVDYISQLGRDIRVELVHKGYLLPLGVPASFVSLAERRFVKTNRGVVAIPVRRSFIVSHPHKSFPAVNQPRGGRDFPARQLVMRTLRTPDLMPVDPDPSPACAPGTVDGICVSANGRVYLPDARPGDIVFWPRVVARKADVEQGHDDGDVEFKWSLDEDTAPISSRLLFISQTMLDSPALPLVASYYNDLKLANGEASPLRQARLNGLRRRYAPEVTAGETSFDTDSWTLGVSGRIAPGSPRSFFDMDPKMNGADQPPFYPIVESALVNVQSLDRLLGQPQGLIKVRFNERYLEKGFDPDVTQGNPAELYLNVLTLGLKLDVDANGPATGGIAKPNSFVAALSRKTGLVGAKAPNSAQALAAGDASPGAYNLEDALQNKLSPSSFFSGGKLLSIVDLGAYVQDALLTDGPQLMERVGYGAAVQADLADTVRRVAQAALVPINAFISALETTLAGTYTGAKLYPVLYAWLTDTRDALKNAVSAVSNPKANISEAVAGLMSAAKGLLAELDHVRRDPVPPLVRGNIDDLATAWEQLKALTEDAFTPIAATLYRQAIAPRMLEICHDLDAADLGGTLLGSGVLPCARAVEDPTSLQYLPETLFSEAFGAPLAAALLTVRQLEAQTTGRIILQEGLLLDRVEVLLRRAADNLIDRLIQPSDVDALNILNAKIQSLLARAVFEAARKVLDAKVLPLGAPPAKVAAQLEDVEIQLRAVGPALQAAIQTQSAAFVVKAGEDATAVITAFELAVIDPVVAATIDAVSVMLREVRERLKPLIQNGSRIAMLATLASRLAEVLPALAQQAAFAQIALLGRKAGLWCHEVAGQSVAPLLAFADDAAGGLLGDLVAADNLINGITTQTMAIAIPPAAPARAQSAKTAILRLLAQLDAGVDRLKEHKAKLHDLNLSVATDPSVCQNIAGVLDHVQALLSERARAADLAQEVASWMVQLKAALPSPPSPDPFKPMAVSAASLLGLITSIQSVGGPGAWMRIKAQIDDVIAALPGQAAYTQALRDRRAALVQKSVNLRATLLAVDGPAKLDAVAGQVVAYVQDSERALIAKVLEAVALPEPIAASMLMRFQSMAHEVAVRLLALHDLCAKLVRLVETALDHRILPTLPPDSLVGDFRIAAKSFVADQADITAAAGANDLLAFQAAVAPLVTRWKSGKSGLSEVAVATAAIINSVLRADLKAALDIDKHIAAVRAELQDIVTKLVPTSIETKYLWGATLPSFSSGDLFGMAPSHRKKDLQIETRIAVDFLNNTRSVTVAGRLAPFNVSLFGGNVATIGFSGADFTSQNGCAPSLKVTVKDVTLGPMLKFIEPLQAWLAPSGSGFYVRPTLATPGIEAGYVFDAGLITLGNLQFLNVSFAVGAVLPFVEGSEPNQKARFTFNLGSPDRPFLIACAPYGGGGFVSLVSAAGQLVSMELGFSFGGVAAIAFGPLKAQGRIVTGMSVAVTTTGTELTGLIEAVGEGSIGCFGICIYIRVLIHQKGQNMFGETQYGFTFSVGFVKFRYSFKAQYTIRGGDSRTQQALLKENRWECAAIAGPDDRTAVNKVPRKIGGWNQLRKRTALDLLGIQT